MELAEAVRSQGGVVRVRALRRRGWSERAINRAVTSGAVSRPRNGWLAAPGADPLLVASARDGVVLSCVTQAQRLGLWVLESPPRPHVAAKPTSGGVCVPRHGDTGQPMALVHWAKPVVPRDPDALVDTIENVLALTAVCLPQEEALVVWESALDRRLITLPELRRLPLRGRARELAESASPFSGSGLETLVPPRLAWLGLRIIQQAWILGHRVDFLIGDRLILQIDGGSHVGAQRTSDIEHDAELMLHGYYVIRVGYDQVVNRWPEVQALIMRAVAQGLHLAR
ncbi:endonuclease domain-containing protein [Microbacterium sp.]|uniref:endonuclease domain-containing protein n=1 Tax=Microbacterium sp. TaxID=51671 RepID=UPI0039E26F93